MFARSALRQAPRAFRGRSTTNATRRVFSAQANAPAGGGAAMGVAIAALVAAAYVNTEATSKSEATAKKLNAHIDDLQVQLSGKTNSAFVFLKPHACKGAPGKVEAVLEDALAKNGIRITGKGTMSAEDIDKNQYIDNHYGAIASKAVKLKPSELNVPDKGKAGFEKMFGESWDSAIAAGKVYNAKDAAEKLGIDAAGINQKWSGLTSGTNLIKFGGGFYCGKVGDIYVMNGFYMSMRAAYCNPGEKIQWYTVSWPTDTLSWEDFRGKVLGATNPTAAPVGSVRRTILDQYKKLGLKTKPNTGDNGVHASASPFEAMAERMNWLGVAVEDDLFGKAMLTKVPKAIIQNWSGDAQVSVSGETDAGKTMSVFDTLEDLDADTILAKVDRIK